MNLSGNLGSFGLDEVLSLLAMGGRTARMHVTGPHALGVVHLVDGEIASASSDVRRAGLLRQVVAAAEVPVSDLATALEGTQPVRGLLEAGIVDADRVRWLADEATVDALAEMLAWRDGQFAVWTGEADPGDLGVRVPVDRALDRARERGDAWSRVREALPAEDAVLSLAPELTEPTSLEVDDWSVLARVDGRRTLGEVLAAVGIAPLVASDRLVGLMARGVVRVRPDDVDRPDEVAAMLEHFESAGPAPQPDPEPVPLLVVVDEGEEPGEPADPVELWSAPGADDPPAAAGVESVEVGRGAAAAAVPAAGDPSPDPVALAAPADAVQPAGLVEPLGVEAFGVVEPVGVEAFGAAGLDTVVPFDAPGGFDEGAASAEPLASDEAFGPVESVGFADAVESVEVVGFAEPVGPLEAAGFAEPVGPLEAAGFADAFGPVEPVGLAEPVGFPDAVAPVAPPPDGVPVAPAVEWSPWAQALGLGAPAPEGELVVDPLAGPGIAEMIAGAHGLNDVEHVLVPPVPMAPEAAAVPEPRFPDVADWAVDAAGLPGHDVAETPVLTADEPAQEPVAEDALQSALLAPLMPGLRGQ